ncbi:hypothetical protein HON71_04520 [Candidatus Woesearchaeota archaeon]|nr:hypothetical protein [Candidatus Woesearchaeota archaeon]
MIFLFIASFSVFADAPLATTNVDIVDTEVILSVDYDQFNEDQDTIVVTSNTFILKNNNAEEVKVVLEATGMPTDYTSESKEVIIPPLSDTSNGEKSVTLIINVPHDKDAGKESIGNVVIKGANNGELDSVTLSQETKSMLSLDNFKVEYIDEDGDQESDSFGESDESFELEKKVKPFTEMTFRFKVENLLDNNYDVDIENILLTIETDDDFFDSDFEEEYEFDDLSADSKEEFEVTFIINEDAEAGDFTIDLTLEGEDEEGSEYKIERELTFDIEKAKEDLRIMETETTPEEVTLCSKDFSFKVALRNFGYKDEKFASLSIFNEELGIDENVETFKIDRHGDDDLWENDFVFSLKNAKAKTYDLDVTTYVDKDEPVDFERVKLEIGKCKVEDKKVVAEEESKTEVITSTLDINENDDESEEDEEELVDDIKTTNEDQEVNTALTSSTIIETIEDSYSQEDFLIGIILVAIVMMLAIIIMFFVVLLK